MSAERALGHINFLLDVLDEADRETGKKGGAPSGASGAASHKFTAFGNSDQVKEGMTVRVTDNLTLLQTEWEECGLGSHNELQAFLNQVGKVTDIEEDDDTLQLTWQNYDTCWMPVRACGDANGAKPTLPGMANSWLGGDSKEDETAAAASSSAAATNEAETLFTSVEDDGVKVGNMVTVTRNKEVLKSRWAEAELGENDTMDAYCGTIGKIVEIEEDDDTVKLQWGNFDTVWVPIKACMDAKGAKATLPGMTVSWLS